MLMKDHVVLPTITILIDSDAVIMDVGNTKRHLRSSTVLNLVSTVKHWSGTSTKFQLMQFFRTPMIPDIPQIFVMFLTISNSWLFQVFQTSGPVQTGPIKLSWAAECNLVSENSKLERGKFARCHWLPHVHPVKKTKSSEVQQHHACVKTTILATSQTCTHDYCTSPFEST